MRQLFILLLPVLLVLTGLAVVAGGIMAAPTIMLIIKGPPPPKPIAVFIPQSSYNPYYTAIKKGADDVAEKAFVELVLKDVNVDAAATQRKILQSVIPEKPAAIIISPVDIDAVNKELLQAKLEGIKVVSIDRDVYPDARHVFIRPVTDKETGFRTMDNVATEIAGSGKFAFLITGEDIDYQVVLKEWAKVRLYKRYPEIKIVTADFEKNALPQKKISRLIKKHKDLKAFAVFSEEAVSFILEAKESGIVPENVKIVSAIFPFDMEKYLKEPSSLLFNPVDEEKLGALTAYVTGMLIKGKELKDEMEIPKFGSLNYDDRKKEVLLGLPGEASRKTMLYNYDKEEVIGGEDCPEDDTGEKSYLCDDEFIKNFEKSIN